MITLTRIYIMQQVIFIIITIKTVFVCSHLKNWWARQTFRIQVKLRVPFRQFLRGTVLDFWGLHILRIFDHPPGSEPRGRARWCRPRWWPDPRHRQPVKKRKKYIFLIFNRWPKSLKHLAYDKKWASSYSLECHLLFYLIDFLLSYWVVCLPEDCKQKVTGLYKKEMPRDKELS